MRLNARRPVAAPPDAVFDRLADFSMFEARAERRGIPVDRIASDPPAWRIGVDWRGVAHEVELHVLSVARPEGYDARVATRGVSGMAAVDIRAGGPGTLLAVDLQLRGEGFAGRMVLQTLTFARGMLQARLDGALGKLALEIEAGAGRGA